MSVGRASRGFLLVGSYNIHRGIGRDGRQETERIGRVIDEISPQLLALQEVDSAPEGDPKPGQLERLGQRPGFECVSGVTLQREDAAYGNAVLSNLPVRAVSRHDVSVARAEPRGVIELELEYEDRTIRLLATHLGLKAAERREQVARLIEVLDARPAIPTLVAGDFNEWRGRRGSLDALSLRLGFRQSPRTYPARRPLFRLDRIWADPRVWETEAIWAHRSPLATRASDHLPICARVRFRAEVP